MTVMEEIVSVMNAFPPLWFLYILIVILPFVLLVSCLLWPKNEDTVAYRKKTDAPTPDDKYKEVIRDSGIEASGETEQDSVEEVSPTSLGQLSQVKEKETIVESEPIKEKNNSEQEESEDQVISRMNGTSAILEDADAANVHSDSGTMQNGVVVEVVDVRVVEDGDDRLKVAEEEEEEEDLKRKRWSFPPILDDFDLMTTEKDPAELEDIFADERLKEVNLKIEAGSTPGLGITIVGGAHSPNGDLPMLIKRIVPGSLVDQEGTIKPGDELVAVNETLLAGVEKDYAAKALSNLEGDVRLLVLQDD